jgi:hypothetical protein
VFGCRIEAVTPSRTVCKSIGDGGYHRQMGHVRGRTVTAPIERTTRALVALFGIIVASCAPSAPQAIFNGRDLTGWHVSESSPHGRTRTWHVADGAIVATQHPPGEGGLLLTDERYGDIEVALDVMVCEGCDSGLFLRSNEGGQAYQVMLDNLEGGIIGSIYGEQMEELNAPAYAEWRRVWRQGEWNHVRARIEGSVPHITVWINGTMTTDWTDVANHAADGAGEGAIGLQVHGGGRWAPGGTLRVRSVTVTRLR